MVDNYHGMNVLIVGQLVQVTYSLFVQDSWDEILMMRTMISTDSILFERFVVELWHLNHRQIDTVNEFDLLQTTNEPLNM